MKMTKQNKIKLTNLLISGGKSGEDYYLQLTDTKKFGFYDFSFDFDGIGLRYFDQGTGEWECTTFIIEDKVNKIQPAFDKLREVLTGLDCVRVEYES